MLPYLLISDFEGTLQAAHESLNKKQIDCLEKLFNRGLFLAVISGSSSKNLLERLINLIPNKYYGSCIFFSNNGACAFKLTNEGKIINLYSYQKEFEKYRVNIHKYIYKIIGALKLDKFFSFDPLNNKEKFCIYIDDKEAQVSVIFKSLADSRSPFVKLLKRLLSKYYGSIFDVHMAGSKTVDIRFNKIDKSFAIKTLIEYLPNIDYSIETEVFIAGDSFKKHGEDLKMIDPYFINPSIIYVGKDELLDYNSVSVYEDEYMGVYEFVSKKVFNREGIKSV